MPYARRTRPGQRLCANSLNSAAAAPSTATSLVVLPLQRSAARRKVAWRGKQPAAPNKSARDLKIFTALASHVPTAFEVYYGQLYFGHARFIIWPNGS